MKQFFGISLQLLVIYLTHLSVDIYANSSNMQCANIH